ncbi:esterase [Sulfurimonas sp.]|nr:esterase [Sulfurimonas sp.]
MIIYIHGFGSSGEGIKAKLFRKYFKEQGIRFIAPSLSYIPELAIKTLEELIESYNEEEVYLMGSSLGGFYSVYLSNKYNLKAVLINPSIYPYKTLPKVLGNAPSFHDESSFTWMQFHIDSLKDYEVTLPRDKNFMLLTQKGDETLNYQEAVDKLPNAYTIIEEGGSHGFDKVERHFENVKTFLTK